MQKRIKLTGNQKHLLNTALEKDWEDNERAKIPRSELAEKYSATLGFKVTTTHLDNAADDITKQWYIGSPFNVKTDKTRLQKLEDKMDSRFNKLEEMILNLKGV